MCTETPFTPAITRRDPRCRIKLRRQINIEWSRLNSVFDGAFAATLQSPAESLARRRGRLRLLLPAHIAPRKYPARLQEGCETAYHDASREVGIRSKSGMSPAVGPRQIRTALGNYVSTSVRTSRLHCQPRRPPWLSPHYAARRSVTQSVCTRPIPESGSRTTQTTVDLRRCQPHLSRIGTSVARALSTSHCPPDDPRRPISTPHRQMVNGRRRFTLQHDGMSELPSPT